MKDDLTDKQRQLVDTIVATGCSIKEAAEKAGYSSKGSKEAARVSASRTLRLPKVQAYMPVSYTHLTLPTNREV